jgi:uncharacterized membrane protein YciS (DUF1049 family)
VTVASHPQAIRARRAALVLSAAAVVCALTFGALGRHFLALPDREAGIPWAMGALVALLFAFLLRIGASLCELVWLERTWTNLPLGSRRVGPIENVDSLMVFGLSFVPVLSWFWKLGLVRSVTDGFERVRETIPFAAPVPRRLGMAAIILGWVPPLNVYLAPFLWEAFARRIDRVCDEIAHAQRGL